MGEGIGSSGKRVENIWKCQIMQGRRERQWDVQGRRTCKNIEKTEFKKEYIDLTFQKKIQGIQVKCVGFERTACSLERSVFHLKQEADAA